MIKVSGKKKEINDIMWSVMTSFGFSEVENNEGLYEDIKKKKGKYCYFDKKITGAVVSGTDTVLAKAEVCAVCIEAVIANGLDNFEIYVGDDKVYEMLTLFGLEKMVKLKKEQQGFSAVSGEIVFASGGFDGNISECIFDMDKFAAALKNGGVDMSDEELSASLIFAEKNAEGAAYDVAYNLRINGCIVEYYNENGDIGDAEKYALEKGLSCILRAYADGKLEIKDFVKNEIIETTVSDFLGYYDEDTECDCGCGHEHHHGEDCDCCGH
ncbi:MAG: hypothetical protein J6C82_03875 [Clostridia bacterium]|nr:hypothetical protein [Clostridia bacterium]